MTPNEMADFLNKVAVYEKPRNRRIKSRYYNLRIHKDGETVEIIEYVAANQVKAIKKEYHADGFLVDTIEDVTVLADDTELEFHPHQDIPEVKGVGGFGTPEACRSIVERDRRKENTKAMRKMSLLNKSKETRRESSFSDPESPLYPMYKKALEKDGFIVKTKDGLTLFTGFQKETAAFIWEMITKKIYAKADLDIQFLGKV